MLIRGKAWVFGDNIDTDIIHPGPYLLSAIPEAAVHAFEAIHPQFSKEVRSGDLIVAGKNFGCGSSRETAVEILKHLGIGCILADSYARIFFRNAIALGMPALVVKDISRKVLPADELDVSIDSGEVIVKRTAEIVKGIPLHQKMLSLIRAGGIDGLLKKLKES
jgi:3-isopropylmalate/(R)-2-methylmalate dehydratase small subunit